MDTTLMDLLLLVHLLSVFLLSAFLPVMAGPVDTGDPIGVTPSLPWWSSSSSTRCWSSTHRLNCPSGCCGGFCCQMTMLVLVGVVPLRPLAGDQCSPFSSAPGDPLFLPEPAFLLTFLAHPRSRAPGTPAMTVGTWNSRVLEYSVHIYIHFR